MQPREISIGNVGSGFGSVDSGPPTPNAAQKKLTTLSAPDRYVGPAHQHQEGPAAAAAAAAAEILPVYRFARKLAKLQTRQRATAGAGAALQRWKASASEQRGGANELISPDGLKDLIAIAPIVETSKKTNNHDAQLATLMDLLCKDITFCYSSGELSGVLERVKPVVDLDAGLTDVQKSSLESFSWHPSAQRALNKLLGPCGIRVDFKKAREEHDPPKNWVEKLGRWAWQFVSAITWLIVVMPRYAASRILGDKPDGNVANATFRIRNPWKLHRRLAKLGKLPANETVRDLLRENDKNQLALEAANEIAELGVWKVQGQWWRSSLALVGTSLMPWPVPDFGVIESLFAVAYAREGRYRELKRRQSNANIDRALKTLEDAKNARHRNAIGTELYNEMRSLLLSLKNNKQERQQIRKNRDSRQMYIEIGSAIATTPAYLIPGPLTIARVAATLTARSSAAAIAEDSLAQDATKRRAKHVSSGQGYVTVIDVYKRLKGLAEEHKDLAQALAYDLFCLSPSAFQALSRTDLVEQKKLKISTSALLGSRTEIRR